MARQRNLKGIHMDSAPLEQPDGTIAYGKNGIQYDTKGATMNEPGFDPVSAGVTGEFIGAIETDGPTVIFSVDAAGVSYVGTYDRTTNTYTQLKNDSTFPATDKWGFKRDFYITGEFQRNFKNERIVAWTDKNQPPRTLNLDNLTGVLAAKDTLLFLQAQTPTVNVDVISGGILAKGAYFVAVKLLKNDGSETGFLTISAPALISSPIAGTVTDKALSISLSNLDTSFNKVQVAIVSRINGAYNAIILDPQEIIPGNETILYTGENLSNVITLDEILVPNAVYSKVGAIGQLNDALYIADLEKDPRLDLTQYALNVKLRVKTELIDAIPQTPDNVNGKKRSLMHQEVYAFYIRYHKKSGGWTDAFHIPGNAPISGDLALTTSPHEVALASKVFQTQDTNRNVDINRGTMDTGIWVNTTETYPDLPAFDATSLGGPNLRGQAVRHHRMPSLQFCKDNFYPGDSDYGRTKLDRLGIEVSNVIIPPSLTSTIDGYEIMIAKRTLANSQVLGQSALLVAAQSNDLKATERGFVSTGGNWHSNTTNNRKQNIHTTPASSPKTLIVTGRDHFAANGNDNILLMGNSDAVGAPKLRFRLHSFDMLFSKPAINPRYMSAQLKMRVDNLEKSYPAGGLIEDGKQTNGVVPVILICDYTKGRVPTTLPSTQRVRQVENTKFIPNGAITNEWNNTHLETAFVGNIKWQGLTSDVTNNDLPLSVDQATINLKSFSTPTQLPKWEETYLVNLMDIKADVYSSFFAQPLVSSGQFIAVGIVSQVVYPGDTFINDYSYHTYGIFDGDDPVPDTVANPDKLTGYKIARRMVCEAVSNINARYEVDGSIYSKWWPASPLTAQPQDTLAYLFDFSRSQDPNQFGYSKDLNTLNDFGNYTCFSPYLEDITKMPFRIHRGGKLPRQGKVRSWRTFLPLDYYEAQKNMGRIKKLVGKQDRLLIHHENALFVTQDKAKLEAGLLSVTLGAGDIFQFEPQEAMPSKQGYAGTQHELGAVDTPWGYVFVDAKQGQIFMYKDGIKLMNLGLNKFFKQYLKITDANPLIGNGITIGYDPEYKRILMTVKNMQISTGITNFVPNYQETTTFFSTLVANTSIVYKNGRFQKFLGVNGTGFACYNPRTPTGANASVTIAEGTASGTVVGNITSMFTEPDGRPLQFMIVGGNTGNAFVLDPVTGVVKVNNSVMLNYQQRTSLALVIRASGPEGLYVDETYTVNLTQVNKAPIIHNYEFLLNEGTANSTNVGQVIATDPQSSPLTYSIVGGSTAFAINASTGMITVLDSTQLVYLTQKAFVLTVAATNSLGTPLTSTCTVVILLAKVNHTPVGTNANITIYKGSSHAGDVVTTLVVSDPDGDPLTITWLNQADWSTKFVYNSIDNTIAIVDPTLFNIGDVYRLNFSVTDPAGLTNTFSVTVTVLLNNLSFGPYNFNCIQAVCASSGDTLAPDNSYCFHFSDAPATPPTGGTPAVADARTNIVYGTFGTVIYASGYASNGTGTYTKIVGTNGWWKNIPGNTTDAPLNRGGLWPHQTGGGGVDNPLSTPVGFTVAVNLPTTKTYYVGIGGDNECQIKVNGVTIVSQDPTALAANCNTVESTTGFGVDVTFKYWHIYPVVLNSGISYIEVTGINLGSVGAFAAEIYNNTSAEIQAATSYAGLNVVFSTKDYIGQNMQIGGSTFGYSCSSGYALVATGDSTNPYTCRKIVTTTPTALHTKHWNNVRVYDGNGLLLTTLNNIASQTYMGQPVPTYPDEVSSPDC